MSTTAIVSYLQRRGTPFAAMFLLLIFCAEAHFLAMGYMNGPEIDLTPGEAYRRHFIRYLQGHPWMVTAYLLPFLTCLAWLQFRESPPWSLWATFCVLTLPGLGYLWICIRVCTY